MDVTLWGRQAEIAGEYCKKGRSIYIEGRLQLDSWEDKTTGQKRNRLRIVGENMQFLGSKSVGGASSSDGEEGGGARYTRPESRSESGSEGRPFNAARTAPRGVVAAVEEEDDIPF